MLLFGIILTPHIVYLITSIMWFLISILSVELAAAIAGTIYIRKHPNTKPSIRYLVYFLWLTVFVEYVFGLMPYYIDHIPLLATLKNGILSTNVWAYNIYIAISGVFYIYFIKQQIHIYWIKRFLRFLIYLFICVYCTSLMMTDSFFVQFQNFPSLCNTLCVLIAVLLLLYDYIMTDEIIPILHIRISAGIGIFVFYILKIPLMLFRYTDSMTGEIVFILRGLLSIACLFLYGLCIIGFILGLRRKLY